MRWSIVRLIWLREMRDQLRDRRTLFMIAILPLLLYPIAGLGLMQLAFSSLTQQQVVLVYGAENLPSSDARLSPFDSQTDPRIWLAAAPAGPGAPLAGVERAMAAASLRLAQPFPALLVRKQGRRLTFPDAYLENASEDRKSLLVRSELLPDASSDNAALVTGVLGRAAWERSWTELSEQQLSKYLGPLRARLDRREVDLVLVVPPGFLKQLEDDGTPPIYVLTRPGDDRSRQVSNRVRGILFRWKTQLKETRLARHGLPADLDEALRIDDPERAKSVGRRSAEGLFDLLIKIFPMVLVMWSLAGALYPAVDLCAGEKERGTMETLLISPASREEIVWGKFLTIWMFSAATALFNLLSMGLTTLPLTNGLPENKIRLSSFFWGILLLLPLSAFFSALSLAVGAYARSSKEGQYYLMPLLLVTMPLVFLTMAPGVELNAFYCLIPVTGVALLLQKLMAAGTPAMDLWLYFIPVLAPMLIYSWLALRWAIEQFQSEEVLFREAERLDLGLWLKRLLREKETLPSGGQALFCFSLILGLRWLALGVGTHLTLLVRTAVSHLAFVATPALFMALLLTTRPARGLGLRRAPPWAWLAAVLLAPACLIPLSLLTQMLVSGFPGLRTALEQGHPLITELQKLREASMSVRWQYFVVLSLLPALCEELAFRGFIFTGLRRRFRPWTAVLLSSFLFALYQMNVFQFLPHFLLGIVLAILVQRSGSVLPAIAFHLVYNSVAMFPLLMPGMFGEFQPASNSSPIPINGWTLLLGAGMGATALSLLALILYRKPISPVEETDTNPVEPSADGLSPEGGRAASDLKSHI